MRSLTGDRYEKSKYTVKTRTGSSFIRHFGLGSENALQRYRSPQSPALVRKHRCHLISVFGIGSEVDLQNRKWLQKWKKLLDTPHREPRRRRHNGLSTFRVCDVDRSFSGEQAGGAVDWRNESAYHP